MRPPLPTAVGGRPTVRVVLPSGPIGASHQGAFDAGLGALERAGCAVRFDPARRDSTWRGYLAGGDAERADELVRALGEPGVDIVWCGRGGSGASRIARQVVEAAATARPRIFVGFSDATALLSPLATRLGWVTFHGPAVTSLGRPAQIQVDLDADLALLRGESSAILYSASAPGPSLEGRLMGGNLTVLASLLGTPSSPAGSVTDPLWLLEDVNEPAYRLDRCFQQLRAAGLLTGARGVWLGDLGVGREESCAIADAFAADASPLPVVMGAPAGHRGRLALLPMGARVRLEPTEGRLLLLEPCVACPRG